MTYTGSEILSSPVVAWNAAVQKTLVFVGNDAGYLTAYDQTTGIPVWSVNLGGSVRSTSLVSGPYLWTAPTTGGRAYKLNAATGATVCSAPIQNATGETVDASPVMATPPGGQPTVYFAENDTGDSNGPVTAINAANCSVDFQSVPEPKPGVGGVWDLLSYGVSQTGEGLVFFGTADPDAAVYAIDAVTGLEVWRFQTFNPAPFTFDVGAGLTVSPPGNNGFADGVVYFANKHGIMYAVDLTTGTEIWEYNFGAQTGLSPAGSLDTAALSGSSLVFGDTGGVWDLNALNGTKLWYHSNGPFGEVDGAPAIIGPSGHQVVVASDLTGSMVVLSLADGSQFYTYQTGAFSVGSPGRDRWQHRGHLGERVRLRFCPGCRRRRGAHHRSLCSSRPVDHRQPQRFGHRLRRRHGRRSDRHGDGEHPAGRRRRNLVGWGVGIMGRQSIPQPGAADDAGIHLDVMDSRVPGPPGWRNV